MQRSFVFRKHGISVFGGETNIYFFFQATTQWHTHMRETCTHTTNFWIFFFSAEIFCCRSAKHYCIKCMRSPTTANTKHKHTCKTWNALVGLTMQTRAKTQMILLSFIVFVSPFSGVFFPLCRFRRWREFFFFFFFFIFFFFGLLLDPPPHTKRMSQQTEPEPVNLLGLFLFSSVSPIMINTVGHTH